MQIDWWTLALQAVNFLVLLWLLQHFLYRPVRAVIEKRSALAERALAEAGTKEEEAETERLGLEADRAKVAQERQALLKTLHDELDTERGKALDAARAEADSLVAEARETIARERKAALTDVKEQAARLATDIASDLLRNTGLQPPGEAVLEQLERRIRELPPDELDRLKHDLSKTGATLTVMTAEALAPESQALWRDRLTAIFGSPDRTVFAVEPAILGGAELHFPHAVIGHSWVQQIEAARSAMVGDDDTP